MCAHGCTPCRSSGDLGGKSDQFGCLRRGVTPLLNDQKRNSVLLLAVLHSVDSDEGGTIHLADPMPGRREPIRERGLVAAIRDDEVNGHRRRLWRDWNHII